MTAKLLVALGAGIVGLGVLAAQNAICLNACEGRHWSRVHALSVPLDIDWGWEWVGEGAETATITVKALRSGAIHEFSLAKPATATKASGRRSPPDNCAAARTERSRRIRWTASSR